jgi:hypothetical protein
MFKPKAIITKIAIGKTSTDSYSATGVLRKVPPKNGREAATTIAPIAIRTLVIRPDLSQRSAPQSRKLNIMP